MVRSRLLSMALSFSIGSQSSVWRLCGSRISSSSEQDTVKTERVERQKNLECQTFILTEQCVWKVSALTRSWRR
ncbi:hypothetical protein F5146DRAFT_607551 [Armillaria mellea]|nr:hypothetical protein F5146DRAFT_607551 [Armillaria mellea]